jgi:hypothetical protein
MSETKFVGKGWAFQYGINISLKKEDLMGLEPNQYGDIKLCVMARREPDEKTKATHFVKVDDYVRGEKPKQSEPEQSEAVPDDEKDSLPF